MSSPSLGRPQPVFIHGAGAVSPAGWSVSDLWKALQRGEPIPAESVQRPGWSTQLPARKVPRPDSRPAFFSHARLRRTSAISQYAVAAALEALGSDQESVKQGALRLGVILCTMSGCVNYSRRFYDETLKDPATASPLIFPETVFNAPASHLAALLESTVVDYTLVGDTPTFLEALPVAAHWLAVGRVEACLVVGAEEMDWLTLDAFRLFNRGFVLSEGAGALYLRATPPAGAPAISLEAVTLPETFRERSERRQAAVRIRHQLEADPLPSVLIDTVQGVPRLDEPERLAWKGWTGERLSPLTILGQGLMAASAWQCVAAVASLHDAARQSALVSQMGCNLQAIGARFGKTDSTPPPSA